MIYNWQKIDDTIIDSLVDDQPIEITIAEKTIGILKQEAEVFAFAATCPHASAKLCDGWVDAQKSLVCPLHKYRFDPVNGRNTSGEGYKLKTYPIEIRNNETYVGLW